MMNSKRTGIRSVFFGAAAALSMIDYINLANGAIQAQASFLAALFLIGSISAFAIELLRPEIKTLAFVALSTLMSLLLFTLSNGLFLKTDVAASLVDQLIAASAMTVLGLATFWHRILLGMIFAAVLDFKIPKKVNRK